MPEQAPIKALRKFDNALVVEDTAGSYEIAFVSPNKEMFDWVAKTLSQFHKQPVLFMGTDKEVQG